MLNQQQQIICSSGTYLYLKILHSGFSQNKLKLEPKSTYHYCEDFETCACTRASCRPAASNCKSKMAFSFFNASFKKLKKWWINAQTKQNTICLSIQCWKTSQYDFNLKLQYKKLRGNSTKLTLKHQSGKKLFW